MTVLQTERLTLRDASLDDAEFILRLLNEPSFLRFIGDRGVRTLDDAQRYIADRLVESYLRNGFGLWIVERRESPGPIGICGLVKREALPDPDIGFAFLPEYWSQGYATESALVVRDHAFRTLRLPRLLAVANADNAPSLGLLAKLGFEFIRKTELSSGGPPVQLFELGAPE